MYPRGRQIEGPARTAPCVPGREAEQVSRLRYLAAVSKLDPDFAEEFLTLVVREVIRRHGSAQPPNVYFGMSFARRQQPSMSSSLRHWSSARRWTGSVRTDHLRPSILRGGVRRALESGCFRSAVGVADRSFLCRVLH